MQIKVYLILDAEDKANKGIADGYCELDGDALVPLERIPTTLTGKDADTVDGHHGDAFILHSLAEAASDFLVASGVGVFIKKTLAEVKAILGLGTAAYTASTDYVTHALATAANDFLVASGAGVFVKKTLAETQALIGGKVVQVVNFQTGALATGTTLIPYDDTIPQNTEGDQYLSRTITPKSATNKLKIKVLINLSHSGSSRLIAALFQDDIADALNVGFNEVWEVSPIHSIPIFHYMVAGTTSEITFKVRGGGASSGTTTLNGKAGARLFGGVFISSITITEIEE